MLSRVPSRQSCQCHSATWCEGKHGEAYAVSKSGEFFNAFALNDSPALSANHNNNNNNNKTYLDVIHGKNVGFSLNHVGHCRSRHLPSANTNLHKILRLHIRQIGRMKVRSRVHAFVQVFFLYISVSIDMNNANVLGCNGGKSTNSGKANRMITSKNNWKCSGRCNVRHGVANLVKGFLFKCVM